MIDCTATSFVLYISFVDLETLGKALLMHEKKYGTYVLWTLLGGIIGLNWYYINEVGTGLKRTFTLNYLFCGWFRDIIMMRKDFNTSMAQQGILSARVRS